MPEDIKIRLEELLGELASSAGDIEASAVVRRDGLMIASNLPSRIDSHTIAAMTAAIVGTAETCSSELKRGDFMQVIVESENGKIVSTGAGKLAILVCLVKPTANLGLVLLSMNRTADKIAEIVGK
ncbi:MAG: roadblock/LC7 domain-containing protein [Candidatus Micrarchaeota archaeon]